MTILRHRLPLGENSRPRHGLRAGTVLLALTGPVAEAVGFDRWLVIVAAVMGGSALLSLLSHDVRRLERHV